MLQTLDEFLEGLLVRKVFLLHRDYFTCSPIIQENYTLCLFDLVVILSIWLLSNYKCRLIFVSMFSGQNWQRIKISLLHDLLFPIIPLNLNF